MCSLWFLLFNDKKMSFIDITKEVFTKFRNKKVKPEEIELKNKVPNALKKSLKLRCVNAGDDEGIMAELYSLEWPQFSLESYNISFTASPKHADGIFVVGAVTKNMEKALKDAWEVVPEPKVIIACGDKAINGDDRFENCKSVKEVLWKVDLEIPWNPSSKDIFNYLVNFIK